LRTVEDNRCASGPNVIEAGFPEIREQFVVCTAHFLRPMQQVKKKIRLASRRSHPLNTMKESVLWMSNFAAEAVIAICTSRNLFIGNYWKQNRPARFGMRLRISSITRN